MTDSKYALGQTMKMVAATFALTIGVAAPQVALGCVYTQAPEDVGQTSGEYFAKVMTDAATYVDLVLIEDDGTRTQDQPDTGVITVRTIARFKGNSADRFSLFGRGLTLKPEAEAVFNAPLQHFTGDSGQVTPFPYNEERQGVLLPLSSDKHSPPPPLILTSCSPPPLSAQTGRFYVVMRGADGHLMNNFLLGGRRTPAFGFVPVKLEKDDFWLGSVARAASKKLQSEVPRALLNLRPGSHLEPIEARLLKAGVRIRAAYFNDGGVIDEVRPPDAATHKPWLSASLSLVRERGKGSLGDANHGAAEHLRAKLGPLQLYGGAMVYEIAQAFAASVRKTQQREVKFELFALEIDGDPQVFAREPFYAGTVPLARTATGLAPIEAPNEAKWFDALQRVERDIWLLNGGNGNRQGTLP